MNIVVIGVGHVGLVSAAALAHAGHHVAGLDDDHAKIELLREGRAPFYEPGLQELIDEVVAAGRLRFTHDPDDALRDAEVAFICVGTPARPDGEANLMAVEQAARTAVDHSGSDLVLVQKSTVPVRTADRLKKVLSRTTSRTLYLVSNPEFLKEGTAVADSLHPDRILVGADEPEGHRIMRELYEPFLHDGAIYYATDIATAELAKHACNAFLASKISFANALARICEEAGADVVSVADIMGSDPRIGRDFLNAGLGYGGYCFPKDLAAFKAQAADLGYEFGLLDEVMKINEQARATAFKKIRAALWNLEGKNVVLLGLAFKAGTDDVRESPSLYLARDLMEAGASVRGYDPQANGAASKEMPELEIFDDLYVAATGADCIVISTEWPEFRELDLVRLKDVMTQPVIVDARNMLLPESAEEAGFTYLPMGRPPVNF